MAAPVEYPPLTPDQQELVANNVALVPWAAKKYFPLLSPQESEEAQGHAFIGLCIAAGKFRPERGKFGTYAVWWVRQGFQRWWEHDRRRADREALRIDWEWLDDENRDRGDFLADDADPWHDWECRDFLDGVLRFLPARDRDILRMRHLDGMTLDETGRKLGVCKERIRQLEKLALARAREVGWKTGLDVFGAVEWGEPAVSKPKKVSVKDRVARIESGLSRAVDALRGLQEGFAALAAELASREAEQKQAPQPAPAANGAKPRQAPAAKEKPPGKAKDGPEKGKAKK